ncbi:MAG: DNA adenine methylase [Clostridiales bacterium]|nr:DNA adenine methylase [Clostridiales bacterium]MCF8023298.1 DNA adenine methylase [Clostridiales bacterium]
MTIIVKPLLKWIGNKYRFADEIVAHMDGEIETYFEPFLGSGAVLAKLAASNEKHFKKAIASDILDPLIEIFKYVKSDPKTLIEHYKMNIEGYNVDKKAKYLEIRNRFNETRNPLDFAVLTRTCYSGVVRFRKQDGYMSTPVGPHKPISPEEFQRRVYSWHELVKDVTFLKSDFKEIMSKAKAGDLIYCDPPYTHSQKILYGSQTFRITDLWEQILKCKQRGVKVILSINGKCKSKQKDISVTVPEGLFERGVDVNCGTSMVNRLQRVGEVMENENVHDLLLFTW